ncbi:MAG TPA: lasso RiPP family leader peptide-containing protein [Reyranella sp.]
MKNDATPTPPRPDQDAKDAQSRKPYEAPVLVRWGTLHELTQSTGFKGANDGARKGQTKTSW